MHLPDGVLPIGVIAAGYAGTAALTWYSLRKIKQRGDAQEQVPRASLLAAGFFVATLINIPVPPTSVHLVLNGLMGAVLGWYAFPAILVSLFFQAILFGHGGITTLGVNGVLIGGPALLAAAVFWLRELRFESRGWTGLCGFLAGSTGIAVGAVALFTLLITTIPATLDAATEQAAIYALTLAHGPLMLIEGAFTALVVLFLLRVQPKLLQRRLLRGESMRRA